MEEEDPDKIFIIEDFNLIAETIRRESIEEFNRRFVDENFQLQAGKDKRGRKKRWAKPDLEKLIELSQVHEIMKEVLPYKEDEQKWCITPKLFSECIIRTARNIFYNICNQLVDAGILELIFDPQTNDFAYRQKTKK